MTRRERITTRCGLVLVERPRKRAVASAWSRESVHHVGLAAVADALGVAAMLPVGGLMTGERLGTLLGRKGGSKPVGKIDKGQSSGNPGQLPLGPTCADALRHVDHVRGRFGAELVGGVL